MSDIFSFGAWVRQRRRTLDLTQAVLAARVGVSTITIQKIEADERRPSRQVATLLAETLGLAGEECERFLRAARAELAVDQIDVTTAALTPPSNHQADGNLPLRLTSFVGRQHELDELTTLLRGPDVRLITLTGPGGIGKTSLALRVAAAFTSSYPDGVWFVDLAPLTDVGRVAATVAHSLRVTMLAGHTAEEALRASLRPKRLLLVLDNCEHVLEAAAALTVDLLRAAPGLDLLVTSRAALNISGEHERVVAPLPLPDRSNPAVDHVVAETDAIRLFTVRAQAATSQFALTPTTAPAVTAICWQLDGLPLAIELAAARVKLYSPDALLARLEQVGRLPMLAGGPRDLPVRQQTIRATINWSYQLLEPIHQMLFGQLAVFAGGFTLDAAADVCGDGGADIATLVEVLVTQSLVQGRVTAVGARRFGMLETIREYAREQLRANGAEEALRTRHAAYFATWAEMIAPKLQASEQLVWLPKVDAESENLEAALAWSFADVPQADQPGRRQIGLRMVGALWPYWHMRGRWLEWQHWAEQARAAATAWVVARTDEPPMLEPLTAHIIARALIAVEEVGGLLGIQSSTQAWVAPMVAFARHSEHPSTLACASLLAAVAEPDPALACVVLEEGARMARAGMDHHVLARVLCELADRLPTTALSRARAVADEALALARSSGDRWLLVRVLYEHHTLAFTRFSDSQVGQRDLEEALELARAIGDRHGVALVLHGLQTYALCDGVYTRLDALNEERLSIEQELGNLAGIANCLTMLADSAGIQGDYERAEALFAQALVAVEQLGEHHPLRRTRQMMVFTALDRGDLTRAHALLAMTAPESGPAAIQEERDLSARWERALLAGELARAEGSWEEAVRHYRVALAAGEALGNIAMQISTNYGLARCALASGDRDLAQKLLERNLAAGGDQLITAIDQADQLIGLARAHRSGGTHVEAGRYLADALMLVQRGPARQRIAVCLEATAALAVSLAAPKAAVRLWGAAAALREQIGAVMWPVDRREHAAEVVHVQAALGAEVFQAVWEAGASLIWTQATDEALSWLANAEATDRTVA